jgi:conjugal transfer pilus assembly protein TraU
MSNRGRRNSFIGLLACVLLLSAASTASAGAVCAGSFLNPITDVCWHCILPIKLGGVTVMPGDPDTLDLSNLPACACPSPAGPRPGIPYSFWEPARYIETVKDPYCFPSLGVGLTNPSPGFLGGGVKKPSFGHSTFAQAHYFIFPVWAMVEIAVNSVCVENTGFDVAYITEVDPLWNDDLVMAMIEPESILFANPVAQLACVADAVSSNIGLPLSPLFWCMGSWGSAYPITGHHASADYVQGNASIAAKTIYKMGRELLLLDTAVALCAAVPTPIWIKQNYRLQLAKPVRDYMCHPIGRSGMLWEYGKNPPWGAAGNSADNFLWMIFRKRSCCAM